MQFILERGPMTRSSLTAIDDDARAFLEKNRYRVNEVLDAFRKETIREDRSVTSYNHLCSMTDHVARELYAIWPELKFEIGGRS